jgi:hypothetical protein
MPQSQSQNNPLKRDSKETKLEEYPWRLEGSKMSAILSFEEMQQHYRNEWLLIAYTELDSDMNVLRGEVLKHSPDVEEVYKALPQRQGRAVAIEYVGEVPQDLAFIL